MIKSVVTEEAPRAIGPYSQAIIADKFVFTSGQIAIDPKTGGLIPGGIKEQAECVMKNLGAVLDVANANFNSIVKTVCFITDMNLFNDFNNVYKRFITNLPARSCVAVKSLPKNVLVEVEAVALLLEEK